ncbi:hypothetical protein BH23BAC1_BH23BAC1_47300 [soil metagenome]
MVWFNFYLYLSTILFFNPKQDEGTLIFNIPGYPQIFELNPGESFKIEKFYSGKKTERTVKLLSVKHTYEPNEWFQEVNSPKNLQEAIVELDVSGTVVNLVHRPYQMPVVVNGVRLLVETTGGFRSIK